MPLFDVLCVHAQVRVRQVISVTETQYSQEDVLIITPDSLPLSVLQVSAHTLTWPHTDFDRPPCDLWWGDLVLKGLC